MKSSTQSLRKAVQLNAVFSSASGASLLLSPISIAEFMHLSDPMILRFVGIGLVVFAISLVYFTRKKSVNPKEIRLVIFQDLTWVLASVALLIARPFEISSGGNILIAGVALIVFSFTVAQWKLLGKLGAGK
ncbi:MAG: hypothetical protein ACI837_002311 [Crocinitomicaceae bacterium]|jgi:hypothetical protein